MRIGYISRHGDVSFSVGFQEALGQTADQMPSASPLAQLDEALQPAAPPQRG